MTRALAMGVLLGLSTWGCDGGLIVDDAAVAPPTDAGTADVDGAIPSPDAGAPGEDAGPVDPPPTAGACDGALEGVSLPYAESGDDFFADFEDTHAFSETECAQLRFGEPHPERVLALDLAAGQTVGACETGPMQAALYVVDGCEGDAPGCLAAASEVDDHRCLEFTAPAAGRYFLVLESYHRADTESAPAYALEVALDPTCGDGTREPGEECDDGNAAAGDGCSSACLFEAGFRCYELGGPTRCAPGGCGDGCVFGDSNSECPAPAIGAGQEECDDFNTTSGDGCDATCDVEEGFNCSAAPSPSRCWPEPSYAGLGPSTETITESFDGMRLTSFHEVQLEVVEATRATITVVAFEAGPDPDELLLDEPAEVRPELLFHEPGRSLVISLDESGGAELAPGRYTLRLRAGANRVGGYTYTLAFGS